MNYTVEYSKSKKAKRITIKIVSSNKVKVTIPNRSSENKAKEFVSKEKDWIETNLTKVKNKELNTKRVNTKKVPFIYAKNILTNRTKELANKDGFNINKIFIKSQKTIWGSCSNKSNINLNYKLAFLPSKYIDYVIFHELVHTLYPNHSRKFWNELEKHVKNAREISKDLDQIRISEL